MSDPIEMICTLSGCPREDAERVYAETGNVVDSVDKLMVCVIPVYQKYIPIRPKKELTEEQIIVNGVR
jgi:preprotein translocase subunit Sec63